MEFEYGYGYMSWVVWDLSTVLYGSLVLDYKVLRHGLEPSILCMVWVWELLNSFLVGLS